MPRFQLSQKVLITGPIVTKYRGCEATVIGFRPNKHTPPGVTSADKYTVRFEEGHETELFDIQLIAADEQRIGA